MTSGESAMSGPSSFGALCETSQVNEILMLRRNRGPYRLTQPGIGETFDEIAMKLVHLALGLERNCILWLLNMLTDGIASIAAGFLE